MACCAFALFILGQIAAGFVALRRAMPLGLLGRPSLEPVANPATAWQLGAPTADPTPRARAVRLGWRAVAVAALIELTLVGGAAAPRGRAARRVDRAERGAHGRVTMNSHIRVVDEATGERSEISLVFPRHADTEQGRTSILAPIGAALLGVAVGATIESPVPDPKLPATRTCSAREQARVSAERRGLAASRPSRMTTSRKESCVQPRTRDTDGQRSGSAWQRRARVPTPDRGGAR